MSDIIKDAKKLLDGATPGPWELIGGEIYRIHHTPEQCTRIRCDHRWPVLSESWGESAAVVAADEDLALMAAVPEMAQVLAEDSYEYIVQVHCEGRWQFYIGESIRPTDKPGLAVGFLQEKYAREFAKIETKRPTRIVRRRVSQPEVINERRCV